MADRTVTQALAVLQADPIVMDVYRRIAACLDGLPEDWDLTASLIAGEFGVEPGHIFAAPAPWEDRWHAVLSILAALIHDRHVTEVVHGFTRLTPIGAL